MKPLDGAAPPAADVIDATGALLPHRGMPRELLPVVGVSNAALARPFEAVTTSRATYMPSMSGVKLGFCAVALLSEARLPFGSTGSDHW